MNTSGWQDKGKRVRQALVASMGAPKTCADAIDAYEKVLKSIWGFSNQLLGDGGTRAVVARALSKAAIKATLLEDLTLHINGVDFTALREKVRTGGCNTLEVVHALTHLGEMIFDTLHDLTGEILVEPLLRLLEGR